MNYRLQTGKKGLALRLHELEAAIMDVVWKRSFKDFCVHDVQRELERSRDIAYTTVMTTLSRLHEKGLLHRKRDGKRYLYSPHLTREQFLESTAREVLDGALDQGQALAMLIEKVSDSSISELDALSELIRKRRKELADE